MKAARVYVTLAVFAALLARVLPAAPAGQPGPRDRAGRRRPGDARRRCCYRSRHGSIVLNDVGRAEGPARASRWPGSGASAGGRTGPAARTKARAASRSAGQLDAAETKARSMGDAAAEKQFGLEQKRGRGEGRNGRQGGDTAPEPSERAARSSRPRGTACLVTAPKRDEVGKLFDRGCTETQPVFAVGDPARLVVRVPVTPPDFRVLRDDLAGRERTGGVDLRQGPQRPGVRAGGCGRCRRRTPRRCRSA